MAPRREVLSSMETQEMRDSRAFAEMTTRWDSWAEYNHPGVEGYPGQPVLQNHADLNQMIARGSPFTTSLSYTINPNDFPGQHVNRITIEPDRIVDLREQFFDELRLKSGENNHPLISNFIRSHIDKMKNSPANYGVLCTYPESGETMLLPDASIYRLAITLSNLPNLPGSKYSPLEAMNLMQKQVIACAGASVGRPIAERTASTMGHELRIADPKPFHPSAGNRGVGKLRDMARGLTKAEITAQAIHAMNPFQRIRAFPGGVNANTIQAFLGGADMLIEEIDTVTRNSKLSHKRALWEAARSMGIPTYTGHDVGILAVIDRRMPGDETLAIGHTDEEWDEAEQNTTDPYAVAKIIVGGRNIDEGLGFTFMGQAGQIFPGGLKQSPHTVAAVSGLLPAAIMSDILGIPSPYARLVLNTMTGESRRYDARGNLIS